MAEQQNDDSGSLKPYLIGGIVALAVSVIAGVAVYLLTVAREPKSSEQLLYQISSPARFTTTGREVRIQSVTIENRGTVPSRDIRAYIRFPGAPRILGIDINFSSGPVAEFKVDTTRRDGVGLTIPVLTPNERLTISYLLEAGAISNPIVSVKSSVSTASELKDAPAKSIEKLTTEEILTLALLLILQGLLLVLLRKLIRRARGWPANRNNVGFVLLHQGMTEQAMSVFQAAILAGDADPYLLANIALATAQKGDMDQASRFLAAADFWASRPREKGHVEFCRALIILLTTKDTMQAETALENAKKSNKDVLKYLAFSHIVEEIRTSSSPKARELLHAPALPK